MDLFNFIAGCCSILGLFLSTLSLYKVTKIEQKISVNNSVKSNISQNKNNVTNGDIVGGNKF